MAKYEAYKEIHLPWLEKIPVTWKWIRNKEFLVENQEIVGNLADNYTLLSLTLRGIIVRDFSEKMGKLPNSFEKYKVIQPGDIVFCLFDMDETPRTVGVSQYQGMLTGAYNVFHVQNINTQYLYYYYLALDNIKALKPLYTGLRKTIKTNTFLSLKMPVPPRAEQDQIVRFLDWKISAINRQISLGKKSLNLATELMNSAFDSLVENSNNTVILKRLVSLNEEFIDIKSDELYKKLGMYNRGRGTFLRDPVEGKDLGDSKFQKIYKDRLIISGQFAWEDAVFITSKQDEEGVASHRYYLLKSINKNVPVEYLLGYFLSSQGFSKLQLCSHGAAGRNRPLNIEELLNIKIPVVDNEVAVQKFCRIIRSYMRLRPIVLRKEKVLQELKTTIISDVVTGKIDVRNIPIPEYEHVDDDVVDTSESTEQEMEEKEN